MLQACRGSELDHGTEVADADSEEMNYDKIYRIPSEADFFYAYSTVPGNVICSLRASVCFHAKDCHHNFVSVFSKVI